MTMLAMVVMMMAMVMLVPLLPELQAMMPVTTMGGRLHKARRVGGQA
ncbi:MAG: hypothetical protein Q7T86_09895 [Hyphomicrobiaceae bacterium]|nr:hypothetical protein [Hyphomicrobiaceae bacterium]